MTIDSLESREVPASIVWTNRGSADGFDAVYGANAATARTIVDQAISDWARVISNFNYTNVGVPGWAPTANTFRVDISAGFLPPSVRGGAGITGIDPAGRPFQADIDLDDNGGDSAWYFDTNPQDNAEFFSLNSRFDATFTNASGFVQTDFYRTVAHELGHALGIAPFQPGLALNKSLVSTGQVGDGFSLFAYTGPSGKVTFTDANDGGGHIFRGLHPNDLLNSGFTVPNSNVVRRQLISDLNANLLKDVYGYTINLPSNRETFLINENPVTDEIVVNGEPGVNDSILVLRTGTSGTIDFIQVAINGIVKDFVVDNPRQASAKINIKSGDGNDSIGLLPGVPANYVFVNGGTGYDVLGTIGTAANESALLDPASGGGLGSLALNGLNRVSFDTSVDQVNYEHGGGVDAAYASPSSTTYFAVVKTPGVGGSLTAVQRGTAGADGVTFTPGPAGGYATVSFSSGLRYLTVGTTVDQINYETAGGNDTVTLGPSSNVFFAVLKTGPGVVNVVARGTAGADSARIQPAPAGGGFGYVGYNTGGFRTVTFDSGIDKITFDGLDGNDSLTVDTTGSTKTYEFIGGNGFDTLFYRGTLASILRNGVESTQTF